MEDIEVSGKHLKLRVVLFIIAFVIGVTAFAVAIYQMTNKKSGYYEITATRDETAPLYSNGYSFYCYIDGKSNEIKSNLNKLQSLYTESLGRISRLLDPVETYEGYVNLATVNERPGEDVALPAELYEILKDAVERSEEAGVSICDGAYNTLWQELRYLEGPEEYDPINDAFTQERIAAARNAAREPGAVRLIFSDESTHTVRLELSETYSKTMVAYEIEAPVLDLGLLREAYTIRYVYRKLTENGITRGYLSHTDGLSMMLPETEAGEITVYGFADGNSEPAAAFAAKGGTASCVLRSFSRGERGYYEIAGILRHPYPGPEAEPNRRMLTAWSVSDTGDLVGTALMSLSLYAADADDAAELLKARATKQISGAFITADAPKTIVADPLHQTETALYSENGYELTVP